MTVLKSCAPMNHFSTVANRFSVQANKTRLHNKNARIRIISWRDKLKHDSRHCVFLASNWSSLTRTSFRPHQEFYFVAIRHTRNVAVVRRQHSIMSRLFMNLLCMSAFFVAPSSAMSLCTSCTTRSTSIWLSPLRISSSAP